MNLALTCDGNPLENQLYAQKRIDRGEIDYETFLCPDGCEVCKSCLYYIINDCVDSKTFEPTSVPTVRSSQQHGQVNGSPFNISDCSSYSLSW